MLERLILSTLAVHKRLPVEIRFVAVSNHRKKTFESEVSNYLKEFKTFVFDGSFLSMYRETHFFSFELNLLNCVKCFTAFRLANWNTNEMILLCFIQYFRPTLKQILKPF